MYTAVFPGSFCPPTYGHLEIVKRALEIFDRLVIVCSRSDNKEYIFSEEECVSFWYTYNIPANVEAVTFSDFAKSNPVGQRLVMVRGLRNTNDFHYEHEVMQLNYERYGIRDFTYLVSDSSFADVSSSSAREAAEKVDLIALSHMVSPQIVTRLLEAALGLENLYLVVGRPGGGKSTFLSTCQEIDPRNIWINTDEYSKAFADKVREHFCGQDIIQVAIENPLKLSELVGHEWLCMLARDLKVARGAQNVFVEAAYGLAEDKQIYRYAGGKILFLGCDEKGQRARIINRGTPELMPFFDTIPCLEESIGIANHEKLSLEVMDTSQVSPNECAEEFLAEKERE